MKRLITGLILLACLLMSLSCAESHLQPPPAAPAPPSTQTPVPAPGIVTSVSPATVTELSISKAPKVGEIVGLAFNLDIVGPVKNIQRVWMEFERYDPALYYPLGRSFDRYKHAQFLAEKFDPSDPTDVYKRDAAAERPETLVPQEKVLVEGDLDWEGDYRELAGNLILNGKIRFPEEGEWVIYARVQSEGETPNYFTEQKLTITEEYGEFDWPKDHSKGGGWQSPKDNAPIAVTLKPSRAPLLGEPLGLTVVLQSNRDVPEGEVYLRFFRQEGSFSNKDADYRVEGDLSWSGSLKKDVPVQLSGKVTFNEEGDWGIEAFSKIPESEGGANMQSIWLHIGKEASRYGWTGSEGPQSPPPEGTPPPAPKPEPRPAPPPEAAK